MTPCLCQTAPKAAFINLSNATPPLATVGACLWILDGQYQELQPGGQPVEVLHKSRRNVIYPCLEGIRTYFNWRACIQ